MPAINRNIIQIIITNIVTTKCTEINNKTNDVLIDEIVNVNISTTSCKLSNWGTKVSQVNKPQMNHYQVLRGLRYDRIT